GGAECPLGGRVDQGGANPRSRMARQRPAISGGSQGTPGHERPSFHHEEPRAARARKSHRRAETDTARPGNGAIANMARGSPPAANVYPNHQPVNRQEVPSAGGRAGKTISPTGVRLDRSERE